MSTSSLFLQNVRPMGGPACDLLIEQGRIAAMGTSLPLPEGAERIDGGGQLLLPGLVESHTHLDKTLWGQPWRPNSAGPTLKDYIANERRVLREIEAPISERAGALLEQCIADHGEFAYGDILGYVGDQPPEPA